MNIKKLSIAAVFGLVATMLASIVPTGLYYSPHLQSQAEKYPDVVNALPNVVPVMIGMIVYLFVTVIIFDKMGVKGTKEGAMTGIWFGAGLWFFFNTQMMGLLPALFDINYAVIDVFISAIMYAFQGAAIGWALERFK